MNPLHEKTFRRFFAARSISLAGSSVFPVSMAVPLALGPVRRLGSDPVRDGESAASAGSGDRSVVVGA